MLVGASIVVTVVLLYLLQKRPFSNRQIRNRRRRNEPVEAGSLASSASLKPVFPTPPLPGQSAGDGEQGVWTSWLNS